MQRFECNSRSRRARRMLGAALGRPLVGPQVVSLETTHFCNLRCSFCESHSILTTPITSRREYVGDRRMMDLERIRSLAKEMAEVGTDMVELSGKGDPITHPELPEIVNAIRDAGMHCALVTNGTLASDALAPVLVDRGLARLSVSLNGGSPESYLRSNKRDLWDKAVGFLRDVVDRKRRAGVELPWVRLTHVVTRENVDDLEAMVAAGPNIGVDELQLHVMGELTHSRHLQLKTEDVGWIREMAPVWSARLAQANIVHNLPVFAAELPLRVNGGGPQDNPLQRKLPCYEGWMFCVIGPDGVVVPCCFCEGEKLGNIYEQSFSEIWYGGLYKAFRRKSLDLPSTGRWICAECFTTCDRAMENRRIYNRTHPIKPIPIEAPALER